MKYAPDRDDPIPADVIAAAIVAASRAVGADPIAVGSGELDVIAGVMNHDRVISRARAYAAFALRSLYPNRNRTLLAAYVGTARRSAGSFFSALDQRLNSGLSWWSKSTVDEVVVFAAQAALDTKLKPAAAAPLKIGPLPAPKPVLRQPMRQVEPRKGAAHGPPRTGLDRFVDRFGRPASYNAGGDDQLQGREREKRVCRDLLAEAAANTAKLQAKLPPEPDGE